MAVSNRASSGKASSAADTTPPRTRLRGPDRRRQIIGVAQRLFAERPYSQVSTTEIATAAGVTHGLLTYHFGSKRNLYIAVLRATLHVPKSPAPQANVDFDLDRELEVMTEWWLTELERNPELWLAAIGARGIGRDPEIDELIDEIEERARADLVAYLSALPPSDASDELWAIAAAWQGLAEATGVEWLRRGRINRAQAKFLVLESLRRLLKLEAPLRRAGVEPDG